MPHCNLEGDYSCQQPKVRYAEGGRLFKLSFGRSPAADWNGEQFVSYDKKRRGKCRGYSFGSRRRMLDRLNSVSCAAEFPEMVSLTLPDESFNDSVTEFSKQAKNWLDAWLKRLRRVCPSACAFWRIEWKARKTGLWVGKLFPHFHLLIWGLPVRDFYGGFNKDGTVIEESFVLVEDVQGEFIEVLKQAIGMKRVAGGLDAALIAENTLPLPGRDQELRRYCDSNGYYGVAKKGQIRRFRRARIMEASRASGFLDEVQKWMVFRDWCALSWYHVVDSHNLKHFEAGVTVERVRSFAGVAYCAKAYLSKVDAESFLSEVEFGRSWGIFNRKFMPWAKIVEMDLSPDAGIRLRRVARRYLEHRLGRRVKRPYGVTLYCDTSQWCRLLAPPPDTPF